MAFYGRGFKLAQSNEIGSPSRGSSRAGKFTNEAGVLSFFEVNLFKCFFFKSYLFLRFVK